MELYTDELVETISSDSSVTVRRSAWGVLKNLGSMCIPEAIDLGLSVKWASFNIGASKPEGYGSYYAWGETKSKDDYSWTTYKWCMGSDYTLTKYCNNSEYGSNGFTDDKTVLDPEDDAAHVNLGGKWRMPTDAEWTELRENCTWTGTTQNGVYGKLVTASNGNSIFLPAAVNWDGTHLGSAYACGYYWSSSLYTDSPLNARYVYFDPNKVIGYRLGRYYGFSVRPVYGDATAISVTGVSLDKTSLSMTVGDTQTLTATITPSNATDKSVTWSSSNTSVATVSSSGVVTAKATGSATITVTTVDGGETATCAVTVKAASVAVPEAIDLGLPSGLKWASFNLGATRPEEYGDYFAWGETETKEYYDWSTYKWCMEGYTTMTKYCQITNYGYNGFTDDKTVLDLEDDAAHVNLGGKWRMPTDSEFSELQSNCTWKWTTQNGVNGRQATGPNGNSIFLPAAGGRYNNSLDAGGSRGYYWSSSLITDKPTSALRGDYGSGTASWSHGYRYYGLSVRPVYGDFFPVESVSLNKTSLVLSEGEYEQLTVTFLPSNATERTVTWSSSNTSVAIVDSNGISSSIVTARAAGSATITVKTSDGAKTATCSVTVKASTGKENGHEWVDLGLPSGLKWATCNVGASKPEEYGDYYAWGETEPKSEYSWSNYKFWTSGDSDSNVKFSKYNISSNYGPVDNKTTLDFSDDAARANWGGRWRMPTKADFNELKDNCTYIWTTVNGANGYKVTGKNGKSIFVPAAGYRGGISSYFVGAYGNYGSASLSTDYPYYAWILYFHSSLFNADSYYYRYHGYTIRPVTE